MYKQLIEQIERAVKNGNYKNEELLPSMNELAESLDISKETVKKAYSLLRDKGLLKATQGKGFYVAADSDNYKMRILMLFDKLSNPKQLLFSSFVSTIEDRAEIALHFHNQQVELMEYYINENLGAYDYYVITPHFPLDQDSQKRAIKQLKRIPNRKLILLDHDIADLRGNYGAVYQDFASDAYEGLKQGLKHLKHLSKLNVIMEPSSLYHPYVIRAVARFCNDYGIPFETYRDVSPEIIRPKEVYLIINGQLDMGLIELVRVARTMHLKPGKDFGIISYNESPLNEIILNGLTTISTDFTQMGRLAAEMVLTNNLQKVKCDFKMTRRNTF